MPFVRDPLNGGDVLLVSPIRGKASAGALPASFSAGRALAHPAHEFCPEEFSPLALTKGMPVDQISYPPEEIRRISVAVLKIKGNYLVWFGNDGDQSVSCFPPNAREVLLPNDCLAYLEEELTRGASLRQSWDLGDIKVLLRSSCPCGGSTCPKTSTTKPGTNLLFPVKATDQKAHPVTFRQGRATGRCAQMS